MKKILIVAGGYSKEREISINSEKNFDESQLSAEQVNKAKKNTSKNFSSCYCTGGS